MGTKIFTTKKMKLEQKNWLKKSLIGTAVAAVLSGAVFGTYLFVRDEGGSGAGQRSHYSSSKASERLSTPAFADTRTAKSVSTGKKSKNTTGEKSAKAKKTKTHKVAKSKKAKKDKIAAKKQKGHNKKMAQVKKHKKKSHDKLAQK